MCTLSRGKSILLIRGNQANLMVHDEDDKKYYPIQTIPNKS